MNVGADSRSSLSTVTGICEFLASVMQSPQPPTNRFIFLTGRCFCFWQRRDMCGEGVQDLSGLCRVVTLAAAGACGQRDSRHRTGAKLPVNAVVTGSHDAQL